MNESQYTQALWKQIGKVGKRGSKYINTGWLDSAFGGAEARKKLTLNRIGAQRDENNRRLDLREMEQNNRREANSNASKDALIGDVITAGGLPLAYMEGRNNAKSNNKLIDLLTAQNKKYKGLIGGYE
jgi:hypothetical protein